MLLPVVSLVRNVEEYYETCHAVMNAIAITLQCDCCKIDITINE